MLFFTDQGLLVLLVGGLAGGIIAACVFAVSAFSVPMLMVRDVDTISAMIASVNTVRANPWPLAVWAGLIAMVTAGAVLTFYIGLIVAFHVDRSRQLARLPARYRRH